MNSDKKRTKDFIDQLVGKKKLGTPEEEAKKSVRQIFEQLKHLKGHPHQEGKKKE